MTQLGVHVKRFRIYYVLRILRTEWGGGVCYDDLFNTPGNNSISVERLLSSEFKKKK